jgi:predicted SprT family Zn-dependent metalloprotease
MIALVVGFFITGHFEKRAWNDGNCKCGTKWSYVKTTNRGDRIYVCENCKKTIAITYPVDKNFEI